MTKYCKIIFDIEVKIQQQDENFLMKHMKLYLQQHKEDFCTNHTKKKKVKHEVTTDIKIT